MFSTDSGYSSSRASAAGMSRRPRGVGSDPRHGGEMSSADSGYGGSSTAAISTHSVPHLVERYQEMTMHPHEGM